MVEVEMGSAAYDAGVEPGDIILEVDQIPVKELTWFTKKIEGYGKSETVLMLADRVGSTLFLTIRIQ